MTGTSSAGGLGLGMRVSWALLAGALLLSCGGVTYVETNPPPRPLSPRTPETVEVYTTQSPSEPYTEIGVMEAEEGLFDDMESMIEAMKEEAADHGCEGIILTQRSEEVTGTSDGSVDSRTVYSATCFVYDAAPGQSAAPWHIRLAAQR